MKKQLIFATVEEIMAVGVKETDAKKLVEYRRTNGIHDYKEVANIGLSWDAMAILAKNWYISAGSPMVNINEQSPIVLLNIFSKPVVKRLEAYWQRGGKRFFTPLDLMNVGISRDYIMDLVKKGRLGVVINTEAGIEQKEVNINCGIVSELMKLNGIGTAYAAKIVAHKAAIRDLSELDGILGRKGISQKVTKGEYRAVVLQVVKKPDLRSQMKAVLRNGNHKLDNGVRSKLMQKADKGKATVQMQCLTFIQAKNNLGFQCMVDITAAPVTAFTAPYAKTGVVLGNSIGRNQFSGERLATDKVATIILSDLVRADESSGNETQEAAARGLRFLLGKIKGQKGSGKIYITKGIAVVNNKLERRDGISVLVELKNGFAITNGYDPAERFKDHDLCWVGKSHIKKEDIIAIYDANRCNIYSTSQKRQDTMMFFDASTDEAVERYEDIFRKATHGEITIRKGEKVTGTMLVDAATRLSSHTCGMGTRADQGFTLKSFCILFDKDDQMDGEGTMIDGCVARATGCRAKDAVGMQIQLRPHTVKATTKVVTTDYMQMTLEGKKLMTIHTGDVPEWLTDELRIKLEKGYDKMVEEATGVKPVAEHLEGYDGIVVVVDTEG